MNRHQADIRVLIKHDSSLDTHVRIAALAAEPDIEIVAEVNDPLDVLVTVKQQRANVVVVAGKQPGQNGLISHLLAQFPDITVLSLGGDDQIWIEQRCHRRSPLRASGVSQIAQALRDAVTSPCDFDDEVEH